MVSREEPVIRDPLTGTVTLISAPAVGAEHERGAAVIAVPRSALGLPKGFLLRSSALRYEYFE
jgi:hypothetical protein